MDCFSTMRGSVADMLPFGWELAPIQSLAGVQAELISQREKDFFVCVDSTVFSKEFATKAQAMKTVSLVQVTRTVQCLERNELLSFLVLS